MTYRVGCEECNTSTEVEQLKVAVSKVEEHNYHYGHTYPNQQYIEEIGSRNGAKSAPGENDG